MAQILIKGEAVYQCDVCDRRIRTLVSRGGIDIVQRCTITHGCKGRLHRVKNINDVNSTPAFPVEVPGVQDWFQRRVEYTHKQPIKSTTWLVKHNLTTAPAIYAYTAKQILVSETPPSDNPPVGTMWYTPTSDIVPAGLYRFDGARWQAPDDTIAVGMMGSQVFEYMTLTPPVNIETIDRNTSRLTFSVAQSGIAQCISHSSQYVSLLDQIAEVQQDVNVVQLTNKGEITIATLNNNPTISVGVVFKSVVGVSGIPATYSNVDNIPSVNSPWVGTRQISLNNRVYTVRSFNVFSGTVPAMMTGGAVDPNAAQFSFSSFSATPGENLILLGTAPFATADRAYGRFIDIASINKSNPETYVNSGNAFAKTSIIKPAFPPIQAIS